MIRVELPYHLRVLAETGIEVHLDVKAEVTLRTVLDALESEYPMLRGTIRDHATGQRRPYLRFFADGKDLSHQTPDDPLPESVVAGTGPLIVLGAVAGG